MIRLTFEKGKGGVLNIINGSIRDIDRTELLNIEDVDRVDINFWSSSPVGFNYALNSIQIAGYIIVFDDHTSWKPYTDQIDMFDGQLFNPGVEGIRYPTWDINRNINEGIMPHTYVNTDIEKDLIKGK